VVHRWLPHPPLLCSCCCCTSIPSAVPSNAARSPTARKACQTGTSTVCVDETPAAERLSRAQVGSNTLKRRSAELCAHALHPGYAHMLCIQATRTSFPQGPCAHTHTHTHTVDRLLTCADHSLKSLPEPTQLLPSPQPFQKCKQAHACICTHVREHTRTHLDKHIHTITQTLKPRHSQAQTTGYATYAPHSPRLLQACAPSALTIRMQQSG